MAKIKQNKLKLEVSVSVSLLTKEMAATDS